jgi:ectonucleotide pyrophosphatase/phosphodiesterase family protein 1/3
MIAVKKRLYLMAIFYVEKGVSYAYENLNTSNATVDAFVSAIEPTKINLALIALAEPDTVGHYHGPNSVALANTIKELDYVLLRLLNKLHVEKGYDIENDIDLIILSDHGMTVQNNRTHEMFDRTHVYLEDYFDNVDQYFLNSSTFSTLSELWLRNPSDLKYVFDRLMTIKSEYDYKVQDVYLKANLPDRLHVKNSIRTAPIIIVAKPGYLVLKNRNSQDSIDEVICMGTHGYDLALSKDMYGMFVAKGKSFRKSVLLDEPLRNIDTYELICNLLHMSPNSNNGTFERVRHLLNHSTSQMQLSIFILFGSLFIVLFIN